MENNTTHTTISVVINVKEGSLFCEACDRVVYISEVVPPHYSGILPDRASDHRYYDHPGPGKGLHITYAKEDNVIDTVPVEEVQLNDTIGFPSYINRLPMVVDGIMYGAENKVHLLNNDGQEYIYDPGEKVDIVQNW